MSITTKFTNSGRLYFQTPSGLLSWNDPRIGIDGYKQKSIKNTRLFINKNDVRTIIPPESIINNDVQLPTIEIVKHPEWIPRKKNKISFYYNILSETTQWQNPLIMKRTIKKKLKDNQYYFCDNNNLYLNPSNELQSFWNDNENINDEDVYLYVKSLIINNKTRGSLRLLVSRESLLEDSYKLLSIKGVDLRRKLDLRFSGEVGVDVGGLTKEWFKLTCDELIKHLLTEDSNKFMTIDPGNHDFRLFKLFGILIAQSLLNDYPLGFKLHPVILKRILGISVTDEDIIKYYKDTDLGWMIYFYNNNDEASVDSLYSPMSLNVIIKDTAYTVPLSNNPDEVVEFKTVTKFIERGLNALTRLYEPIQHTTIQLNSIIPIDWLRMINCEHLSTVLAGSVFDRENFLTNINVLVDGVDNETCTAYLNQIKSLLHSYSDESLLSLYEAITGLKQPPYGGFSKSTRPFTFKIHRGDRIATAHTCFNRLDLFIDCPVPIDKQFELLINTTGFGIA